MDSEDDDIGPANPSFQLKLDLGGARPKPLSESNRTQFASAHTGQLTACSRLIDIEQKLHV